MLRIIIYAFLSRVWRQDMEERVKGAEIIIHAHDRRIDPSLLQCLFQHLHHHLQDFSTMMFQQSGEAAAKKALEAKTNPKPKKKASAKSKVKTELAEDSVFGKIQAAADEEEESDKPGTEEPETPNDG